MVLLSVIILYYLFNAPTFLPYTEEGLINWQNVIVLIFFTSVILINLLSTLFVLINNLILKRVYDRKIFYRSLKISGILTFGIITVFILNFLHILNIYYGLAILGVAILTALVI